MAAGFLSGCGQPPVETSGTDPQRLQLLETEISQLRQQLDRARRQVDELEAELAGTPQAVVQESGRSTQEILDELKEIKMTGENRRSVQRRINFLLESLMEKGPATVPSIRQFMARMEDVEFSVQRDRNGNDNNRRNRDRSRATLNFEQPPSMRIGMMEVLKEIGGEQAEQALVEVLAKTGRGVEVAYVSRILKSISGNNHREDAVAAAHDLLLNPIQIENPGSLDRNAKNYLFMVLEMFEDMTFIQSAQTMLINDEGRIDRTVLDYLDDVGKEQAVDAIYQAFNSGQIKNTTDKASLARTGLQFSGRNAQANQMFKDIMTGDDYSNIVKFSSLREMDDADEPEVLQARLQLMRGMTFNEDDMVGKAVDLYSNRIENKINGVEESKQDREAAQELYREVFRNMREQSDRDRGGRNRGERREDRQPGPAVFPAP